MEERYGEYYTWLISLIDPPPYGSDSRLREYGMLLYEFWVREFYWFDEYENDECRANDGKLLRDDYMMQFDRTPDYVPQGPCRLLEMLVAFALRIDNQVHDWRIGHRPWEWIEMFIDNLGLGELTDESMTSMDSRSYIQSRIDIMLSHQLGPHNENGLFRFKRPMMPNRLDLWGQMNLWILENF